MVSVRLVKRINQSHTMRTQWLTTDLMSSAIHTDYVHMLKVLRQKVLGLLDRLEKPTPNSPCQPQLPI